jgi:hypothetical protein
MHYASRIPTITLKNVPKPLHAKLLKRAKAHKRFFESRSDSLH